MHPQGFPKGKTDTNLCGPLGADETVSDLVDTLSSAAVSVRRDADVVAWPYSAHWVWSDDIYQTGLIRRMTPQASLLTEVLTEKLFLARTAWSTRTGTTVSLKSAQANGLNVRLNWRATPAGRCTFTLSPSYLWISWWSAAPPFPVPVVRTCR